jgi:hypothetical protein
MNTMTNTCGENYSSEGEELVQTALHCSLKMAYQLENPSKGDQRAVTQLLRVDGCQPTEICGCVYAVVLHV